MKVAILYPADDAPESEYSAQDIAGRDDIAHIQGVKESLERLGNQVMLVPMDFSSYDVLKAANIDLAFNLCDSGFLNKAQFEPHVASILDLLQIPYTGSDSVTLATTIDKTRVKKLLSYHHIPTARFQTFFRHTDRISKHLQFPLFVKPNQEHASIGIRSDNLVRNEAELRKKVREITMHYHQPALVEEYINGREIHTFLLGTNDSVDVLPLAEIEFLDFPADAPKIFTYEAKWDQDSEIYRKTPYVCPAKLGPEVRTRIIELAKHVYGALAIHDYGRVDFRIDPQGDPMVVDVNPNCDISPTDYIKLMLKEANLSYDQFIGRIVDSALERANVHGSIGGNPKISTTLRRTPKALDEGSA